MKQNALTKAARGQACTNCGSTHGVVLAHYSGLRQHLFGKSRGIKGDDEYAAPQCSACHDNGPFTEGYMPPGFEHESRDVRRIAKSEEQLVQILMWRDMQR